MAVRLEMLCSLFIMVVAAGALLIGESPGENVDFAMKILLREKCVATFGP